MSAFTAFEKEVLRLLASPVLAAENVEELVRDAKAVKYEFTGSGYFLTVTHPHLPEEKITCADPIVVGHSGAIDCGFVLFLGGREATLECHTWGATDVPADFRSREVRIEVRDDIARKKA